jgi:hypothetical protein
VLIWFELGIARTCFGAHAANRTVGITPGEILGPARIEITVARALIADRGVNWNLGGSDRF